MPDAQDALVAAVVRLDGRRRSLQEDLVAEEGTSLALRTELDAQRALVVERDATIAQGTQLLDACKATRAWQTQRIAQLEAAWPSGTPLPAPLTPKP